MDIIDFLGRIAVGMALAAVLGFEREAAGKAAGLRTHAMVGLGSAVFTVVGMEAFESADTSRVAAQIVSGIGFLGAGAIFRSGPLVKGLTTAAGLWAAAAVGMAAGTGQLLWAVMAAGLAAIVLAGLRLLEPLLSRFRRGIALEASVRPAKSMLDVRQALELIDPTSDLKDARMDDDDTVTLVFIVGPDQMSLVHTSLQAMEHVVATRVLD